MEFTKYNTVLPVTEHSATISSDLYASLRKAGESIDDIDILIAEIALSKNLAFVTHNEKHFKRIEGLEIADWSKEEEDRRRWS